MSAVAGCLKYLRKCKVLKDRGYGTNPKVFHLACVLQSQCFAGIDEGRPYLVEGGPHFHDKDTLLEQR